MVRPNAQHIEALATAPKRSRGQATLAEVLEDSDVGAFGGIQPEIHQFREQSPKAGRNNHYKRAALPRPAATCQEADPAPTAAPGHRGPH